MSNLQTWITRKNRTVRFQIFCELENKCQNCEIKSLVNRTVCVHTFCELENECHNDKIKSLLQKKKNGEQNYILPTQQVNDILMDFHMWSN